MPLPARCLRRAKHSHPCSPDLTGMKIGGFLVKRLGPSNKGIQWFVEVNGVEKLVYSYAMISGKITGKYYNSGYQSRDGKRSPEYVTVMSHKGLIFNPSNSKHKNYKGMPFYDGWNPSKGGAIWKGAKWIVDNLGIRPGPQWSMDIINHEFGFVPGNLRWANKNTQARNQQHRTLGQWSEEEFAVEAHRRGYIKVNIEVAS